jgi:hypothetical protein
MELASTMAAHGLPEAADQALSLAEQALHNTIRNLATVQTLISEKVDQFELVGLKLPAETASHVASYTAATAAEAATGLIEGHKAAGAACCEYPSELDSWSSADSVTSGCIKNQHPVAGLQ